MAIVVGTGGFERRFAYTLPAFTGTHNAVLTFRQWDFPTAAIDGGADSFLNGGGDFRACLNSDGTGELPTHVVRLVTGVAPDIEVKVYVTGAASGQTIYFFGKKAGAVAYAVTEPFGRNATYQDYEFFLPMQELTLPFIDVTGNGYDATGVLVSGVTSANHPTGGTWPIYEGSSTQTITGSKSALDSSPLTLGCIARAEVSSTSNGVLGNRNSLLDNNWAQLQSSGRVFVKGNSLEDSADPSIATPINTNVTMSLTHSSSALRSYRDGVQVAIDSSIGNPSGIVGSHDYRIGTYFSNVTGFRFHGNLCGVYGSRVEKSADLLLLESDNIFNSGSSWGTVGALEDTTGGGGTTYEDFLNLQTSSSLLNSILGTFESSLQLPSLSALSFQPNIEFNTESLIGSSSSDTYSLGQLIEESLALNTSSTLSQSVVNIIDVVKTEDTLSNISSSASLDINLSQNLSSSQALTTAVQKVINETLLLSVTSTFQTSLGNIFNELVTLSSSLDVTSDVTAVYAGDVTLSSVSTTFSNANATYDISLELSSTNSDSYLAGNTFEEVVSLESAVALTVESAFGELTQTPTRRTLYISSENRVVTIVAEKRTISI